MRQSRVSLASASVERLIARRNHVVELGGLCRQADFDVAQTLAVGWLCKGQYAELIGACHGLYAVIAVVAIDDAMKRLPWQKIHELGEQRLADVHAWLRVCYSRIFLDFHFYIQVGDTCRRSQSIAALGMPRFTLLFNRTAVIFL